MAIASRELYDTANFILKSRRMTKFGITSILFSIITYALCYLLLIQSIFLPNDLTNPAIATTITDKEAMKYSDSAFMILRNFNNGISDIEPNGDMFAFLPVNLAVTLSVYYKLSEDYETDNKAASKKRVKKFKYEPTFDLRLNRGTLIFFLLTEMILISVLINMIRLSKNKYTYNYEEEILRSYHDVMFGFINSEEDSKKNSASTIKKECLVLLLTNLHLFIIQMTRRHNNRPCITINDELDLQHIFFSLLLIIFPNASKEYFTTEKLGSNSRIDFFIQDIHTGIELKHVTSRKNSKPGLLAEQILIDIKRYQANKDLKKLIFLIYDPEMTILDFNNETKELVNEDEVEIKIIFSPPR
ncbi:hypothetical protein [Pantoea ananatis]|uniref:PD-(D/E)XK nuclease domain-containing protein n=1 Tax=Pantoea ananas TaxID=553 RepID=UPI000EE61CD4|nr:hypothetical protein [Pantoea ananatis]NQE77361.1 hypothetical protein [Pantoea ananatis]NQE81904.1 hypothetical protein [Pantoea ananatis]HCP27840.1 hypothetical protein [Pantoea ananatis]